MIHFDLIKSEALRKLVIASESINSQPEDAIVTMVARIAELPESGEQRLIAALEDEQRKIMMAKTAQGITPEVEKQRLQDGMDKIVILQKKLDMDVLVEHEKEDRGNTDRDAETLLQQL